MKKIVGSLLFITSLQLSAATAPMIINRTGAPIKITYKNGVNPVVSPADITVANDQMVIIPATNVVNPSAATAGANYQNSATSATILVNGTADASIASIAAGTSYVIKPDPTATGKYKVQSAVIQYDETTGTRLSTSQDISLLTQPDYQGF